MAAVLCCKRVDAANLAIEVDVGHLIHKAKVALSDLFVRAK